MLYATGCVLHPGKRGSSTCRQPSGGDAVGPVSTFPEDLLLGDAASFAIIIISLKTGGLGFYEVTKPISHDKSRLCLVCWDYMLSVCLPLGRCPWAVAWHCCHCPQGVGRADLPHLEGNPECGIQSESLLEATGGPQAELCPGLGVGRPLETHSRVPGAAPGIKDSVGYTGPKGDGLGHGGQIRGRAPPNKEERVASGQAGSPQSPRPWTRSASRPHVGTPGTLQPAQVWTPGRFCPGWLLGPEQCDESQGD